MKYKIWKMALSTVVFFGWSCSNTPPAPIAEETTKTSEPVKSAEITETNPDELTKTGIDLLLKKEYKKAIAYFQKILTLEVTKENIAMAHYNSACAYSLLEDKENGLKSLALSIKNGYEDVAFIESDPDLVFLRTLPEYKEILKSIPPIVYVEPTDKDEKAQAEAIKLIEETRGLKPKEPVKYKILEPKQFGRLYGKNAEGIQGFYRYNDKTLYLRNDLEPVRDKATRIHETFHAIQDQLFDLTKLQQQVKTTDENYTLTALIEGDATLTFIECLPGSRAKQMVEIPPPWERGGAEEMYNPGLVDNVFRFFNYSIAARFIKDIRKADGWEAINKIYANPPKSTEQILHPEKYLEQKDAPVSVAIPALDKILGAEWEISKPDTKGELITLLELLTNPQSGPKAKEYAQGWGGDTYVRCFNRSKKQAFGVWKTVWDTEKDAEEFCEGLRLMTEAGYKEKVVPVKNDDNSWRYNLGEISDGVYIKGKSVIAIQGIPNKLFHTIMDKLKD